WRGGKTASVNALYRSSAGKASTADDRRADGERLVRFPHIVRSDELHPLARRPQGCGERAADALARAATAAEAADEGLARRAQHARASRRMEQRKPRQEREVVRVLLAEADAGIDGDALAGNARGLARADARFQEIEHVERGIVVLGILLHGAGIARHVHEHD